MSWVVVDDPMVFVNDTRFAFLYSDFTTPSYRNVSDKPVLLVCAPTGEDDAWQWAEQLTKLRLTRFSRDKLWFNATEVWVLSRTKPLDTYPIGYMFANEPTATLSEATRKGALTITPVSPL